MAFCWRANDGPPLVVFGSSLSNPHQLEKNVLEGPPLTKLSGSTHLNVLSCHIT